MLDLTIEHLAFPFGLLLGLGVIGFLPKSLLVTQIAIFILIVALLVPSAAVLLGKDPRHWGLWSPLIGGLFRGLALGISLILFIRAALAGGPLFGL